MGLKELLLNKGWAGRTISRKETIERLNPLIRRHYELNHRYDAAIRSLDDRDAAEQLNVLQKTARADVGKLSETVLSAGGVSYNGTDLNPEDFDVGDDDKTVVSDLQHFESEFEGLLSEELDVEHQMRTRAILGTVLRNSRARLDYVSGLARTRR